MAAALPGAAVIKAKQLFDQLDVSQMTPEELQQHAALKQQLESQPAVQVAARSKAPPAARFGDPHGYQPSMLETAAPPLAHPLDALSSFASSLNPLPALAHPINAFKSDWNARGAAAERLKARGSKLLTADPADPQSGEDLRNMFEALVPGLGPALAGAGRQMNSPNPHEQAKGFGSAVALTSGPKIVSGAAGAISRVGVPAYTRLTARFPERMIGSIAGSESRAGARAVMARRISANGDPGNLPVENFAKNVSAATNQAGADVSRIIDTHTAANKGAAVDVADALQKPYEKRIAEVAKFARGEQAADTQIAALTDQAEARQRAAAEYAGLKNWQPGEPIPMTPSQMHRFTKDWRSSVKGGFDRMEPTEQAAIMNVHDAIKSTVPDAAAAMKDYHDLLRYNENLQTYANPEGGAVQAGSLVPELTSTIRGAARRKIAGGAGWKVPVSYWLNEHAPAGYRYTGTYNPARLPAANAAGLAGGASGAPQAVAPSAPATAAAPAAPAAQAQAAPTPAPQAAPIAPRAPTGRTVAQASAEPLEPSAAAPAPEALTAAPAAPQAVPQRVQTPVRRSASAQQTLRPRKPGEPASVTEESKASQAPTQTAKAPAPTAPTAQAAKAPSAAPAAPSAPPKPQQPATVPLASRPPSQMTAAELKDLLPRLREQASAAKGDAAKKLNMRADIAAGELKRRLAAEGKPVANPLESLGSKPLAAKPATAALSPGDAVKTKVGTGTVTHIVDKPDGSTVHFVDGVKTKSGRTVIHKPSGGSGDQQ